jgi:FMN phosphatase YigB (HAD superfamily)
MITTILFDLDGTLLPLEDKAFLRIYFGLMAKRFSPRGYEPKAFIDAIYEGTKAMVANPGNDTNETVFWETFNRHLSHRIPDLEAEFYQFYQTDFALVRASTMTNPLARKTIDLLKEKGYSVALATNPIFPRIATEQRIRWAGLEPDDFDLVTTYENCHSAKPSPAYYREVLAVLKKRPEECLMVGNDAIEDLAAGNIGIATYLMTDCLVNPTGVDLSTTPHGTFAAFHEIVQRLPDRGSKP